MRVEICVDSVEGALAAQRGGADRVELCDNLMEGGTTPSGGCIKQARSGLRIGLQVIIRPRGGDFLYSPAELDVMREDIQLAKSWGADGVVLGCLKSGGDLDLETTSELVALARPMSVTFHRAFDMCRDPGQGLEDLIRLGIDRVLTSGQESNCLEGLDQIAALNRQAGDRIVVMPGGGITSRNARRIVAATGVSEIHLSARVTVPSAMEYRNPNCFMGGALRPAEYSMKRTDESTVHAVVQAMRQRPET
jgi:copper homeostasis protein